MPTLRLLLIERRSLLRQGIERLLADHPDLEVVDSRPSLGPSLGGSDELLQARGAPQALVLGEDPDLAPALARRLGLPGSGAGPDELWVTWLGGPGPSPGPAPIRLGLEAGLEGLLEALRTLPGAGAEEPAEPAPEDLDPRALVAQLSRRELEVLAELMGGRSNRAIGARMGLSPHTVRNHLANIYLKLQVEDRTQAALLAVRAGWAAEPT